MSKNDPRFTTQKEFKTELLILKCIRNLHNNLNWDEIFNAKIRLEFLQILSMLEFNEQGMSPQCYTLPKYSMS